MSDTGILCIENLSKTYGNNRALNGVNLTLKGGRIYGLIGQNGAGKTTLIRMISGLGFAEEGKITLFGKSDERSLTNERKRLGCMIEYPSLSPTMNAHENLRIQRIMRGIRDSKVEDEMLEKVGLTNTGNKKAKDFSLGMKQRLGIAIAMLSNPELLILDEPINGLDPVGVVEIRHLLKKLCQERKLTILISSHNLPELHETATDYIIVHKGAIRRQISQAELDLACKRHMVIRSVKPNSLAPIIQSVLKTTNFEVDADGSIKLYDFLDRTDFVGQALYDNGIAVSQLALQGETLESYYMSIIEEANVGNA
ncbi:MAG: ATP-binding cassette domain-containing protein [Oscillospiraceae bacterium]